MATNKPKTMSIGRMDKRVAQLRSEADALQAFADGQRAKYAELGDAQIDGLKFTIRMVQGNYQIARADDYARPDEDGAL